MRLSPTLYAELMRWADEDFRSLNGQIEYLLTECMKKRKGENRSMNDEIWILLIVSLIAFAIVAGTLIFEIVWIKKTYRKYFYRFQSHDIVFEVARRSVRLCVDGNLEDELGGRLRICMLRAAVEGTEIKVRYEIRGFKTRLDVTAGNTPLQLMGTSK